MFLDVLFLGVGLNSSRLLLKERVRLVVGFCGEGNGWFWGASLVGTIILLFRYSVFRILQLPLIVPFHSALRCRRNFYFFRLLCIHETPLRGHSTSASSGVKGGCKKANTSQMIYHRGDEHCIAELMSWHASYR